MNKVSDGDLHVTTNLVIPEREIDFSASRSGGPGGQHVNKTSTRVTLAFDVEGSESLTREQKNKLWARLGNRMTGDGVLKVSSGETRSQFSNREIARKRLAEMIGKALVPPKRRKKTKPSRAAKERRIQRKKKRGMKKKLRQSPSMDDSA
jgi:ribosome-associated protein